LTSNDFVSVGNQIGSAGFTAVVAALKRNTRVTYAELDDNAEGRRHWMQFNLFRNVKTVHALLETL
jgi:hypothetical protein